jgi:hypothetical protein
MAATDVPKGKVTGSKRPVDGKDAASNSKDAASDGKDGTSELAMKLATIVEHARVFSLDYLGAERFQRAQDLIKKAEDLLQKPHDAKHLASFKEMFLEFSDLVTRGWDG